MTSNRTMTDYRLNLIIAAWAMLIALLALTPRMRSIIDPENPHGLNHGPVAHLAAYAILAIILHERLTRSGQNNAANKGAIIAGSYGALIEFGQYLVPYRSFDPSDIAPNFAAAIIGIMIQKVYYHFITKSRNSL
jgi:VanZ family protein